jgi:mannose-6-phosphate isomerase class I
MTNPSTETSTDAATEATPWRETTQALAPAHVTPTPPGQYDIYPTFPLPSGTVLFGLDTLAEALAAHEAVILDGYVGVFWDDLRDRLAAQPALQDLDVRWIDVAEALRPEAEIDALIAPFLGGDDPIFGTRFTGHLRDFFDAEALAALRPDPSADLTVLYGCGAALAGWDGLLAYVEVPKNEIQFRSRAGAVTNLGAASPAPPKVMYKRFYFVDWVALNDHKAALLDDLDLVVDAQRPDAPTWMRGDALRAGLGRMSRTCFRVRPWFEPGAWGGQWMKRHIPQLTTDVPNYAWSFELIVPENGLAFSSDGRALEVAFDWLMIHDSAAVLGDTAHCFGREFPIRFDFLDTIEGGNLSLQCHPRPDYIRQHFGEAFTQDETYYILDCDPGAQVYLGFQDDIDPDAFRADLERSQAEGTKVDVERYVQTHPACKHDLFLIPNGTVHCSGRGNMVLEISATPYIFTFKMYDWLRLDLDGKPRPINIERAFDNLHFDRKGDRVEQELIATPAVIDEGPGWQREHLATHPVHFYDVHRFRFEDALDVRTDGSCHVLSLVEGVSIRVETAEGLTQQFSYAETFVVPAAAGRYRLVNEAEAPAMVVCAFLKPGITPEDL